MIINNLRSNNFRNYFLQKLSRSLKNQIKNEINETDVLINILEFFKALDFTTFEDIIMEIENFSTMEMENTENVPILG